MIKISCMLVLVSTLGSLVKGGPKLRTITIDTPCHTSAECPSDSCCRKNNGDIIMLTGAFDIIGPISTTKNGTCVPLLAQLGEHCGDFCQCDDYQGLACFRAEVSDHDITPSTCQEKSIIKSLKKKWNDCYSDPDCQLPFSL